MKNRFARFIGELPADYEYKIFQYDNEIKIVGINPEKEPICFTIDAEMRLSRLKIEPNNMYWE
jgi:hypothetical protein